MLLEGLRFSSPAAAKEFSSRRDRRLWSCTSLQHTRSLVMRNGRTGAQEWGTNVTHQDASKQNEQEPGTPRLTCTEHMLALASLLGAVLVIKKSLSQALRSIAAQTEGRKDGLTEGVRPLAQNRALCDSPTLHDLTVDHERTHCVQQANCMCAIRSPFQTHPSGGSINVTNLYTRRVRGMGKRGRCRATSHPRTRSVRCCEPGPATWQERSGDLLLSRASICAPHLLTIEANLLPPTA